MGLESLWNNRLNLRTAGSPNSPISCLFVRFVGDKGEWRMREIEPDNEVTAKPLLQSAFVCVPISLCASVSLWPFSLSLS